MPKLIVKPKERVGMMYDEFPDMDVGDKVYIDGRSYKVVEVMHFLDAGKGIKEYEKFQEGYNFFTRYTLS